MKLNIKILFLALWVSLGGIMYGQTRAVTLEIKHSALYISGTRLERPWNWDEVLPLLGKPDAVDEGELNTLYTFDRLGLVVFTNGASEFVREIQVSISNMGENDFSPSNPFSGTFIADGVTMGKTVPEKKLNSLKKFEMEESYSGGWRMETKGLYFYVTYEEGSNKKVSYFSIGLEDNN